MANQILSEEFRRMQKLAGIINEEQFNEAKSSFPYEKFGQILLAASETYPPIKSNPKYPLYDKNQIKPTLNYIKKLEKGIKNEDYDVFDELEETNPPESFDNRYEVDTREFNKWNDLDWKLNAVGDIWYEYDFDFATKALNDLAEEINKFEL